ncbi:hypothetical protein BpHYR1_028224, partial [Brachionus plicatilis]
MFVFNLMTKQNLFYGEYLARARLFYRTRDRHLYCFDQHSLNHCQKFLPKFNFDRILSVKKIILIKKEFNLKTTRFDKYQKVKIYRNRKLKKNSQISRVKSKNKQLSFLGNKSVDQADVVLKAPSSSCLQKIKKNSSFNRIIEKKESIEIPRRIISGHDLNLKVSSESINLQSKRSSLDFLQNERDTSQHFQESTHPDRFSQPYLSFLESEPSSHRISNSLKSFKKFSIENQDNEESNSEERKSFFKSLSSTQSNEDNLKKTSIKINNQKINDDKKLTEELKKNSIKINNQKINDDKKLTGEFKKYSILSKKSINKFSIETLDGKIEIEELIKADSDGKILTNNKLEIKNREEKSKKLEKKDEKIEIIEEMHDVNNSLSEIQKSKISILKAVLPEAIIKDSAKKSEKKKKSLDKFIQSIGPSDNLLDSGQILTENFNKEDKINGLLDEKKPEFENIKINENDSEAFPKNVNNFITEKEPRSLEFVENVEKKKNSDDDGEKIQNDDIQNHAKNKI